MRGQGEPLFDFDFPPGLDTIGEIMNGLRTCGRMEVELFSRLEESARSGQLQCGAIAVDVMRIQWCL